MKAIIMVQKPMTTNTKDTITNRKSTTQECQDHDHGEEASSGHSDEIILPKAKADAAGVKVSVIEPGTFEQVIKTSGQILAAQGDESVAVATVAGVISFHGKVTEGMSTNKGATLLTISSSNIADGDPVQRARVAYEISKKEYERMKALVKKKYPGKRRRLCNNRTAIGKRYTKPPSLPAGRGFRKILSISAHHRLG